MEPSDPVRRTGTAPSHLGSIAWGWRLLCPGMNFQIALLLCILAVALALFSWERIAADVVALGVLLALVFTGLLPKDNAFDGFGSDAVIMILGLLILTAAL